MHTRLILAMLTIFTLPTFIYAREAKRATPPTAKELVGTWIGFDRDELTFTRLELHADSTGYLARVSPADTILHDYGVQAYRVNKWSVSDWNVAIDLTPISSNAEVLYLKGRAGMADLDLEIGGLNKRWKLKVLLYPESRIETSNRETKQVIEAASVRRSSVENVTQCGGTSVAVPNCWHKLDAGPFSISAPPGWEFHQLPGVDSYVGQFVGDGVVLTFDFGRYSTELRNAKKPGYVIAKKPVDGRSAKVVSPRTLGNGITGVYVRVSGHEALCLWGKDLTSPQQELVLKIFDTIRFGGPTPPYVIPPPPPPPATHRD
jgi:hypothetical protein